VPGEDVAPVPLGEAIAAVGEELGLGDPRAMGRLLHAWPDMVGEAIAAHARIRSLRRGVLTIAVDAAPWATQLRYLETEIVVRATAALGAEVREARIVVEATDEEGRAKRRNERA
jgi:predicted nucleic acid-binding Zn ribbon protein